jgi:hypothetical protein
MIKVLGVVFDVAMDVFIFSTDVVRVVIDACQTRVQKTIQSSRNTKN